MSMFTDFKDLLNFLEDHNVTDESADDGDGYTDTWKSAEFSLLIHNAKKSLEELKHLP
jgi:hypothetical protein